MTTPKSSFTRRWLWRMGQIGVLLGLLALGYLGRRYYQVAEAVATLSMPDGCGSIVTSGPYEERQWLARWLPPSWRVSWPCQGPQQVAVSFYSVKYSQEEIAHTMAAMAALSYIPEVEMGFWGEDHGIEAPVLASLKGLHCVGRLQLYDGRTVTDETVPYLEDIAVRDTLVLRFSPLTDRGFVRLRRWQNMMQLQLEYLPNMTGSSLSQYPRLQRITLLFCATSDEGLAAMGQCAELRWLTIEQGSLTGTGLRAFAHHPRLETLAIMSCPDFRASELGSLAEVKTLQLIEFTDSVLDEEDVRGLSQLGQLKDLSIFDSAISEELLARLRAALPKTEVTYNAPQPASPGE
jgi:hypothetical protein